MQGDVSRHGSTIQAHSSEDKALPGVDSANAARKDFPLKRHGILEQDINAVWTAIALHTTPGIPTHMHPVVALLTAGVEMDVLASLRRIFRRRAGGGEHSRARPARSPDFAKLVRLFDAHQVSFVSVTQAFNTTTSMGRLTLNVLHSFAWARRRP